MTFRVEGNYGGSFDGDAYKKALEMLKSTGNNKPTSEQIKAAMDRLANNQKSDTIPGFEVEKSPDDNTFVDFNDGAVPKKAIKDMTKEELIDFLKGKTYSIGEGGETTKALGEEGGNLATTQAVGEEGGGSVTYALGEGGSLGTSKAMGEEGGGSVTYALGEGGEPIKIDEETVKKIKQMLETLKRQQDVNADIDKVTQETIKKLLEEMQATTKGMHEEGGSADILNKMKEYIETHKPDFQ